MSTFLYFAEINLHECHFWQPTPRKSCTFLSRCIHVWKTILTRKKNKDAFLFFPICKELHTLHWASSWKAVKKDLHSEIVLKCCILLFFLTSWWHFPSLDSLSAQHEGPQPVTALPQFRTCVYVATSPQNVHNPVQFPCIFDPSQQTEQRDLFQQSVNKLSEQTTPSSVCIFRGLYYFYSSLSVTLVKRVNATFP